MNQAMRAPNEMTFLTPSTTSPSGRDPASNQKPKVLVVENDPCVSAALWTLLDRFDFEVVSETSGPAGRQLAQSLSPDAVILNVNLPEMNGLEICRQLKSDPETRSLPVIFCSSQYYLADEAVEQGAAAFVAMPGDTMNLPDCLLAVLHTRKPA
jgi:two-component system phosphate regulon response regulator PhoB